MGHFAVGLVAKRMAPKISLGTGVLASMAADLLGCIFLIAGIEHVHIKPGMGAANYFDASDIPMSHSLGMDVIWAAVFAAVYSLWRNYSRGAWVLFVAVVSHWLLDFVSHRPDMPLAPGVRNATQCRPEPDAAIGDSLGALEGFAVASDSPHRLPWKRR